MIARTLRTHPLMAMHLALLAVLSLGLLERSGLRFAHWLLLYAVAVSVFYLCAWRWLPAFNVPQRSPRLSVDRLVSMVLVLLPLFAVVHWWRSGGPPTWQAIMAADELTTSALRDAPKHETWIWLNYVGLLFISAILPFTIAVAYHRRHRACPWLMGMGAVYAVSLLPKSYVVVIFLPLFVLLLAERRFLRVALLGAACLACIMGLAWLSDPDKLRGATSESSSVIVPVDAGVERHGVVGDALLHIGRRVFLTPGWTVADWFMHIPTDIPWAHGAAVRPIALLTGKPYVDIASRMYEIQYPEEVARGIHGTVPSAAFMYDYANYGGLGLLLSAVLVGSSFVLVHRVVGLQGSWAVALGLFPVLALASTAFTTVLVTHGWLATMLLFHFVRPERMNDRTV